MESGLLTPRELRRYRKQITIPGIGEEGQQRLKNARVLVVGAGGSGCTLLQYITGSGIGNIGIVEFDTIDESDFLSQVIYGSMDVGKLKVIIAKEWLERFNPMVKIEVFNLRLDKSNAIGIIEPFDLIVDATNISKTSNIISDSCVILDKPMIYGAISGSEGKVSVFNFNGGPTYKCYNAHQKKEDDRNQSSSGTWQPGILYGMSGTLMANELIKIITGIGSVLCGKILIFNTFDNSFRIQEIENIPANHLITELKEES